MSFICISKFIGKYSGKNFSLIVIEIYNVQKFNKKFVRYLLGK